MRQTANQLSTVKLDSYKKCYKIANNPELFDIIFFKFELTNA